MPRASSDALASLRLHLDRAIQACAKGWEDWVILVEASAFVAEGMAKDLAPTAADDAVPDESRFPAWMAARAYRRVAGLCRGAAALPSDLALPILQEAVTRLGE